MMCCLDNPNALKVCVCVGGGETFTSQVWYSCEAHSHTLQKHNNCYTYISTPLKPVNTVSLWGILPGLDHWWENFKTSSSYKLNISLPDSYSWPCGHDQSLLLVMSWGEVLKAHPQFKNQTPPCGASQCLVLSSHGFISQVVWLPKKVCTTLQRCE